MVNRIDKSSLQSHLTPFRFTSMHRQAGPEGFVLGILALHEVLCEIDVAKPSPYIGHIITEDGEPVVRQLGSTFELAVHFSDDGIAGYSSIARNRTDFLLSTSDIPK